MSIQKNTPDQNSDTGVPDGVADGVASLISPRQASALNHLSDLEKRESGGDIGMVPNLLARFSLIPTSGIGDVGSWSKTNDYGTVGITPGWKLDPKTGESVLGRVPRGGMANLSLLWLVNQVRQNLERKSDDPARIDLGDTMNAYLRSLGVVKGGRSYKLALTAMQEVLGASIQLLDTRSITNASKETTNVSRMLRMHVADSYELWDPNGNELAGFAPHAVAGSAMLRLAGDPGAVPVRFDVMAKLADSVIAQQALSWLTLKLWTLDVQQDKFHEFTWDELYRNITHNYSSTEKFRAGWKKQLARVVEFFPEVGPYIDMAAIPEKNTTGNRGQRVIRIRRGARPIVPPRQKR